MNDADIKSATEEAIKLFSASVECLSKAQQISNTGGTPQVFPSGIELISLKFKIGTQVDIGFTIAGKSAPVKVDSLRSETPNVSDVDDGLVVDDNA
jgi:hypothetical protein